MRSSICRLLILALCVPLLANCTSVSVPQLAAQPATPTRAPQPTRRPATPIVDAPRPTATTLPSIEAGWDRVVRRDLLTIAIPPTWKTIGLDPAQREQALAELAKSQPEIVAQASAEQPLLHLVAVDTAPYAAYVASSVVVMEVPEPQTTTPEAYLVDMEAQLVSLDGLMTLEEQRTVTRSDQEALELRFTQQQTLANGEQATMTVLHNVVFFGNRLFVIRMASEQNGAAHYAPIFEGMMQSFRLLGNPGETVAAASSAATAVASSEPGAAPSEALSAAPQAAGVANGLFRGNARRTGVYDAVGPRQEPKVAWRFQTDEGVISESAILASPVVVDGIVYFGSHDGKVRGLDLATGAVRWQYDTQSAVIGPPAVANGVVYTEGRGTLLSIDQTSSNLRWSSESYGPIGNSAAVVDDAVYFGGGYRGNGQMVAADRETGEVRWVFKTGAHMHSSPAVGDGGVYFGSEDGSFYAVDQASGELLWKVDALLNFASPAVVDGVVYFGDYDKHVSAYDARTGTQRWQFTADESVLVSPIVTDDSVFISSFSTLYALDRETGVERWSLPLDVRYVSSPSYADGVLYMGGANGRVIAVDAATGDIVWEVNVGAHVTTAIAIADGTIVLGVEGGELIALR